MIVSCILNPTQVFFCQKSTDQNRKTGHGLSIFSEMGFASDLYFAFGEQASMSSLGRGTLVPYCESIIYHFRLKFFCEGSPFTILITR
jgi:hypothetical protein